MNNYNFCAQWILDNKINGEIKILDYGCGAGQIIKILQNNNINAFGCDVFYEGGDYSTDIDSSLMNTVIKRMENDSIPYNNNLFDFVINNQVMEHVENLDSVLAEIHRVLKPGGMVLSLFPDKGVWREGHCGIPFLHWFPKGTRPRVYYALAYRTLGLGYHKENKTKMNWSEDFCQWLDDWTYYRSRHEIDLSYEKYFIDTRHIEDYWLQQRLGTRRGMVTWLAVPIQKFIVRKLAGLIFVAKKPTQP